jgi:protein-tyrosine phosphatase
MDVNQIVESADEILPGLWLGNQATSQSKNFIKNNKISLVVNATKHVDSKFLGDIHYIRVPVNDPGVLGIASEGNEDVEIMKKSIPLVLKQILKFRKGGRNVLVHCHAGAQRSAIIVLAYLLYRGHFNNIDKAINYIVSKRPIAFFGGSSVNFIKVFN